MKEKPKPVPGTNTDMRDIRCIIAEKEKFKDIRKEICRIVSDMLDNPDEHKIYPTTQCYDELEKFINEAIEYGKSKELSKKLDKEYDYVNKIEEAYEEGFKAGGKLYLDKSINKILGIARNSGDDPENEIEINKGKFKKGLIKVGLI